MDNKTIDKLFQKPGLQCEYGCMKKDLLFMVSLAKSLSPKKEIRVVGKWQWIDVDSSDSHFLFVEDKFVIIIAEEIYYETSDSEPMKIKIKSYPLLKFHENCLFETHMEFYILLGKGIKKQVSISEIQ